LPEFQGTLPAQCGLLIEDGSNRIFQAICAPFFLSRWTANLPLVRKVTHQEPEQESLPYTLAIVISFQEFQDLLFRRGIAVKHQCEMTAFFHKDQLCPGDILGGELCLLEGDQCVVLCM
jgi:hypothetical protein